MTDAEFTFALERAMGDPLADVEAIRKKIIQRTE